MDKNGWRHDQRLKQISWVDWSEPWLARQKVSERRTALYTSSIDLTIKERGFGEDKIIESRVQSASPGSKPTKLVVVAARRGGSKSQPRQIKAVEKGTTSLPSLFITLLSDRTIMIMNSICQFQSGCCLFMVPAIWNDTLSSCCVA